MSVSLKGDQPFENVPSVKAKALRINLNEHIYGTFAEIGAGQEVARHFFRSGGASGTIAKTMSAYDKAFSDAIYGHETDNGYVSESRLKKMLDYETKLLEDRMNRKEHPNKMFFTYANTVATIDFAKNTKLLLEKQFWGKYNLVCEGTSSRLEVAKEMLKILKK